MNQPTASVKDDGQLLEDGCRVHGPFMGDGQRGYTSNYGVGRESDNWRARHNAKPLVVVRTNGD